MAHGIGSVGAWLLVVVGLGACRASERRPLTEDAIVPKPPGAASGDDGGGTMGPSGDGWVRTDESAAPERADRAAALEAIRKAPRRAVVVHDETIEECSSAGGSHAFFTLAPPAQGIVHFGGHGATLGDAFDKGAVWVAGYDALPSPESVKNDAWCVPDRTIHGRALALVPVPSVEDGERLVGDLSR